ncbi:Solute carrier family 2, facilitated glucose transporter member 12-like [Oopsacas minuta]|uniref:Solute carrier family 2, facilitated glucose transporter member 12-like n=1 Tax=Oopsacas minuta TaxID=111878 RepID=A0AAV7JGH4_9METZ|nr:Solute carrier family 2, facilitated glucose transporter member 12-like [Oopsacas minuta]
MTIKFPRYNVVHDVSRRLQILNSTAIVSGIIIDSFYFASQYDNQTFSITDDQCISKQFSIPSLFPFSFNTWDIFANAIESTEGTFILFMTNFTARVVIENGLPVIYAASVKIDSKELIVVVNMATYKNGTLPFSAFSLPEICSEYTCNSCYHSSAVDMDTNDCNTLANAELCTEDSTPFLSNIKSTEHGSIASDSLVTQKSYTARLIAYIHGNIYLYSAAVLAIAGGVLFGYDLGIISGAILQLRIEFCLGIVRSEIVVSSLVAGAFFGSLTGGILVDFLGRKVSIILDSVVFCVGAVILIFSESFWLLVIGRLIIGYGVSLSATAECVYVSEIAPSKKRGMLVSLNELGICLGILLAYTVSYLFVDIQEGWRYMFGLSIIPALLQGIGTLFLPRTPRFLLMKGKKELALKTLQKIRGYETDVSDEFNEMRTAILEERRYHWWDLFRLKDCMLQRMLIGCMVVLFQQLSGQNSLLYYTPTLLKVLGFPSNQAATLATIGVGANKFLFSIITFFTIDKLGRRPLSLIDPHLILSNNSSIHLANCDNTTLSPQSEYIFPNNLTLSNSQHTSVTATKWLSLILLMIYVGAYEISFGSIAWLLLCELFPPSVRGQAVSLATTVNWAMNFIVAVSILSVYHLLLGYMYIMYGVFCLIALCSVFFLVPETKGRSLENISEELKTAKMCFWGRWKG